MYMPSVRSFGRVCIRTPPHIPSHPIMRRVECRIPSPSNASKCPNTHCPSSDQTFPHLLQPPHHPPPNLGINHAPDPERRNNPTHPSSRTLRPIAHHAADTPIRPAHARLRPIIQIQTEQMQRGRHELDRSRRDKLRRARRTDVFLQPGAHVLFERRRE
jgi:hypothetical protein